MLPVQRSARTDSKSRCYLLLPDIYPDDYKPSWLQFRHKYACSLDQLCVGLIRQSPCGSVPRPDALLLSIFSTYTLVPEHFKNKFSGILNIAPSVIFYGSRSKRLASAPSIGVPMSRLVFVDTETMGVHHSKYIILFTECYIHVLITTANLVPQTCLDMCWVQSFPRFSEGHGGFKRCEEVTGCNDFGLVLQDFIESQARSGSGTDYDSRQLIGFLWSSAKVSNSSLHSTFDFCDAEASLVSVVPGKFVVLDDATLIPSDATPLGSDKTAQQRDAKCRSCLREHLKTQPHFEAHNGSYGSHRIRMCLRLRTKDCLRALTPEDTLIVQPTSIGNGVRNAFMSEMLDSYMPSGEELTTPHSFRDEDAWRIIWPTRRFVRASEDLFPDIGQRNDPKEARASQNISDSDSAWGIFGENEGKGGELNNRDGVDDPEGTTQESSLVSGHFFLHAQTLALMEPDILHQMRTYAPNKVAKTLGQEMVSPHMKSYTRIYSSLNEIAGVSTSCTCTPLAWFLLTSACLSKGAQGQMSINRIECKRCLSNDIISCLDFRNFELGVMLHSSGENGILYRALDAQCPLHGVSACGLGDTKPSAFHDYIIPLPFELKGGEEYYCAATASFHHLPYLSNSRDIIKLGLKNSLPTQFSPVKLKRSRSDDNPTSTLPMHGADSARSVSYDCSGACELSPEIILRARTFDSVSVTSASISVPHASALRMSSENEGKWEMPKPTRLRVEDYLCD